MTQTLVFDLQTDKAITTSQLERHYSLDSTHLPKGVYVTEHSLTTTKGSNDPALHSFVCTSRTIARRAGRKLQHLAGVAEMRHLLGVKVDDWKSRADASNAATEADGDWRTESGLIAIEYDIGSYSTAYMLTKLQALEKHNYRRLVWGCPSETLVRKRQALFENEGMDVDVIHVPWC